MNKLLAFLGSLYILAVVFAPPLAGESSELVRYEDFIIIVAAIVAWLTTFHSWDKRVFPPFTALLVVTYLLILLILVSSSLNSLSAEWFDFDGMYKELFRLAKYTPVVFVYANIKSEPYQKLIRRTIMLAGVGTVGVQLFQYFGSPAMNRSLADFYGGGIHFSPASSASKGPDYFYAGGPFANPNVAGAFLLIPFGLATWQLVSAYGESDLEYKLTNLRGLFVILMPAVLFTGLVLTRSRVALAAALALIIMCLRLSTRSIGGSASKILLAILIGLLVVTGPWSPFAIGLPGLDDYRQGFEEGGSLAAKMQILQRNFAGVENVVLGLGPHGGTQIDFEYGYFLIWYGPLGIIVYALLWWVILGSLFKYRDYYQDWQALVVISIGILLSNISQTSFLNSRMFPIFIAVYFLHVKWDAWPRKTSVPSLVESQFRLR